MDLFNWQSRCSGRQGYRYSFSKQTSLNPWEGRLCPYQRKQMASLHSNIFLSIPSVISVSPQATHIRMNLLPFQWPRKMVLLSSFSTNSKGSQVKGRCEERTFWQRAIMKKWQKPQTEERNKESPCFPFTMIEKREWMKDQAVSRLHAEQTVDSLVPLGPPSFDGYASSYYTTPMLFMHFELEQIRIVGLFLMLFWRVVT